MSKDWGKPGRTVNVWTGSEAEDEMTHSVSRTAVLGGILNELGRLW